MIIVTGLKKLSNGLYAKDPIIKSSIYLTPMGSISVDMSICDTDKELSKEFIPSIDRTALVYDVQITDPYESLLFFGTREGHTGCFVYECK